VVADGLEDARRSLAALVDDEASGIIAVNEAMMAGIDERLQQKIDSIYRPIVVSLPIKETLHVGEDHRAYLSRLIRRAIGFDITLRRG
jgi:vacuolar-type H+-ATPase subunit F/Vma7